MKGEEKKKEEKARETKMKESTTSMRGRGVRTRRTGGGSGAGRARVESIEVVKEAPKRMPVQEIAAQTLVLDENGFIAARLEDAAAREAQQAAALEADRGIGIEALRTWAEHKSPSSKEPAMIDQGPSEHTSIETITPSNTTMAVTGRHPGGRAHLTPLAIVPAAAAVDTPAAELTPVVPAVVEMWTCPATGETMPMSERAHYLANCVEYRDCWQAELAALLEKLGKAEVENRVSKLYQNGLCSAGEAFCSLGKCGGDVDICMERLRSEEYREEMQLACEASNLEQYVLAKRKKRKKNKKKKRPQDGGSEGGTKERRRKKKTPAAEVREAAAAEEEKTANASRRPPPPPTGPPPTGTGEGANRYRAGTSSSVASSFTESWKPIDE